ncbi:hypothetical protein ACTA71_001381 [Dictyostelium dimigraforme]
MNKTIYLLLYLIVFIGCVYSNNCCQGPLNDNLKCLNIYYDNFVIEYHCINDTLFVFNNQSSSQENYNDLPPLSLMNSSTMIIPNSIPICGKCDPRLTKPFIGIVLFIAFLIIGILISLLFYFNRDNKNGSQYLPIQSPGSSPSSLSSSFVISNQNHNSNNNIYNPYYNSSPTSPYHLSQNSNNPSLNPSLLLYHQSRLPGNFHSINNYNNHHHHHLNSSNQFKNGENN